MLKRILSSSLSFALLSFTLTVFALAPSRAAAADCQVQMRSIVFGARSSSHDFVTYAVRLYGAPQTGSNAQLSVRLTDGSDVEVPW